MTCLSWRSVGGCSPMRHSVFMIADRSQCPFCGYVLDEPGAICPVCYPFSEVPEHVKHEWAMAHLRGIILHLGNDDAVVREACLWEEHAFLEEDARPLLLRMEEDREIERFGGYYRVRGQLERLA
jgi:hypothetical protein